MSESCERNDRRDGKARVPDVAIFATAKKLVPPSQEEGFEEVYRVRIEEGSGFGGVPWSGTPS